MLPRRSRMAVVATAEAGDQAVALSLALNSDMILFDTGLVDGLAIVASLVGAVPAIPIIALAVAETEHAILTWAESGVTGYVHRSASIIELIDTAILAARGEQKCSTKVAGAMLRRLHQLAATAKRVGHSTTQTTEAGLTPHEREVAQLSPTALHNADRRPQFEAAPCEASHPQHARTQRPDALRQERYSKTEARLTPREREVAQLVADGLQQTDRPAPEHGSGDREVPHAPYTRQAEISATQQPGALGPPTRSGSRQPWRPSGAEGLSPHLHPWVDFQPQPKIGQCGWPNATSTRSS